MGIEVLNALLALHSNMFLLIPLVFCIASTTSRFTFQYVSINTASVSHDSQRVFVFTFQYVSINTARSGSRYIELLRFTFQYVSINTVADKITAIQEEPLHSNMFLLIPMPTHYCKKQLYLYIPICFY